jgi:predicted transcriptional regulator
MTDTVTDVPLEPADAKRLTKLGRTIATATLERNYLIRELHAKGAGIREIARAVGLAPASVLNIIEPRKRS